MKKMYKKIEVCQHYQLIIINGKIVIINNLANKIHFY